MKFRHLPVRIHKKPVIQESYLPYEPISLEAHVRPTQVSVAAWAPWFISLVDWLTTGRSCNFVSKPVQAAFESIRPRRSRREIS